MLVLKSVNFEQQQFQHHYIKPAQPGQMEWVVGRNPTCDLILPSPEVSRTHGRIIYDDDAYHFMDVGSTVGSLLNGKSLPVNDRRKLRAGDLLQLGETFLYVEDVAAPLPSEAETDIYPTLLPKEQWENEDILCRCCRIVDETPDVKTFYFIAEPRVLFHYLPGQFVNLEIEIDGKPVIRSYSISSSPTRPYHLSLTIKRVPRPADQPDVPAGLVSNWLHDHLKVGDRVKLLGGALGQFTCLPSLPSKILMISAGSGITPMMSMTRWVQDTLADCDIVFLHSARTSEDIVFRAELEAIAAQMPNFHLLITVTQQPMGRPWMGLTGRISESMLHLVTPDLAERSVFVCGPNAFMGNIRSLLEEMQFPMQNYQEESFGGRTAAKPGSTTSRSLSAPNNTAVSQRAEHNGNGHHTTAMATKPESSTADPEINFVQSERQVSADGSASILEVAEQEGISIRHACRVGACGACKVRVRQGQVRYDTTPTALTKVDQQAGYALACVAYPVDKLAIEA